jgi:hypothetical protein
MAITLSVVGIFFEITLDKLTVDTPVIDILAAAKAKVAAGGVEVGKLDTPVSRFDYDAPINPTTGNQSLQSFSVTYNGHVQGRNARNTYPPGEYHLAEDFQKDTNIRNIWQYYTLDAEGKTTNPTGDVRFLNSPEAKVVADGHLIWRCVSILTPPLTRFGNAAE